MKPMSAVMVECLAEAIEHGGELVHHAGGHWTWPGCPRVDGVPEWRAGTSTVRSLVKRGELIWAGTIIKQGKILPVRALAVIRKGTP
jgi:hypothetical protein